MDNFYWEHYIKINSDIYPKTKESAWEHLINIGISNNYFFCAYPIKNNFDWKHYINLYSDLKNAGIDNKESAWLHWYTTGKIEGRIIAILDEKNIFDWERYVDEYEDLKNINTQTQAWYHWINQGRYEKRIFFNKDSYDINFYFENFLQIYKLVKLENIYNKEQAYKFWLENKKEYIYTVNIDSCSFFDSINLSNDIPFATLKDFYKIYKGFKPLTKWIFLNDDLNIGITGRSDSTGKITGIDSLEKDVISLKVSNIKNTHNYNRDK